MARGRAGEHPALLRRAARCGLGLALAALLLAACADPAAPAPPAAADPPALPAAGQLWPTQIPTPTFAWPTAGSVGDAPSPAAAGEGASPTDPAWTFAVVGDTWKDTPLLRTILADTAAAHDAVLVDLGDLTPQGRPEQLAAFATLARGAGLPVYAVPGNHDVAWAHTTAAFEQHWPRHQSFDLRNAHFTLVDDSAVTLAPAELAWIRADLAATAQPLRFVFMHVPAVLPYPVPSEEALAAGGPAFQALMTQYHVTAVFAGHLHAFVRTVQDGVPYIITGGGGEPLHVPALFGGRYHYVRVAIAGARTTITPIWLDAVPTPAP